MPASVPAPRLKTSGRVAISSVHWLTLLDTSVRIPAAAWPRHTNSMATMNSGASDASGASHCTSRNSSIPNARPDSTSPCANGSAEMKMTYAAKTPMAAVMPRRDDFGRRPSIAAGPASSGSSAGARAVAHVYAPIECQKHDCVEHVDLALERDQQGVDGRGQQHAHLQRLAALEHNAPGAASLP